jgi:hypothetical protein
LAVAIAAAIPVSATAAATSAVTASRLAGWSRNGRPDASSSAVSHAAVSDECLPVALTGAPSPFPFSDQKVFVPLPTVTHGDRIALENTQKQHHVSRSGSRASACPATSPVNDTSGTLPY